MADWLTRDSVLLDVQAPTLSVAMTAAAGALSRATGIDVSSIEDTLREATRESDFAIGAGIAVPHVEIPGLASRVVAVVRLAEPLDVGAIDRMPADLVFVILFPTGDPTGHLEFLAHLARLARSRVFRDGLRSARSPDEVVTLVDAAEARRAAGPHTAAETATTQRYMAVIKLVGEAAVDSALVELLDQGLGHAVVLDALSVRDAASREVPLFAGFRDIFGDPGGQRIILAQALADQVDEIMAIVRRACDKLQSARGEVMFVPVAAHWVWQEKEDAAPAAPGH